jgi:NAD(P)-dependent dehydrogenase (short-subunit alcohol dehydrogenase family)
MKIAGCAALVTGTRRIGGTIALHLSRAGARVALVYRHSRNEAENMLRQIEAEGGQGLLVQADLSLREEVFAAVQQSRETWGEIDILVHAASIYQSKPFDNLTLEDWENNLNGNLRSAFFCAQAILPSMRSRGKGRIILFSDWVAASGRPRYKGYLPYYVSKVGMIGLAQALALELARDQILVNAIAPGPIVPPPGLTEEEIQEVNRATPLGGWGGSEEIAKTVLSLIESDFITGECIRVDGGRHIC